MLHVFQRQGKADAETITVNIHFGGNKMFKKKNLMKINFNYALHFVHVLHYIRLVKGLAIPQHPLMVVTGTKVYINDCSDFLFAIKRR